MSSSSASRSAAKRPATDLPEGPDVPLHPGLLRCRTANPLGLSPLPASIFPARQTCAYNPPIPPRIHCQAWQRGGVGAGCGEETQDLTHRACGKWSPSGDMGEATGCRTDPVVSCPKWRAGCACAARKGAGTGGCVGIVRRVEQAGRRKSSVGIARACGFDVKTALFPPGNRRVTSAIPGFAEGPESRAKTAERGAERCHIHYFSRGSSQRPVRNALEPTGGNPPRGRWCRNDRRKWGYRPMPAAPRRSSAPAIPPACRRHGWRNRAWRRGSRPWRR